MLKTKSRSNSSLMHVCRVDFGVELVLNLLGKCGFLRVYAGLMHKEKQDKTPVRRRSCLYTGVSAIA